MADRKDRRLSRRDIARGLLGGMGAVGAASCRSVEEEAGAREPTAKQLIPPPDARYQTTACAYCIVGCGYRVYSWPVDAPAGGRKADQNGLGVDFPVPPAGPWVSPEMVNTVSIEGEPHHIAIIPDWQTPVVNPTGDHTLGGSLAKRLYNPTTETARLLKPQIRIGEQLYDITWDEATRVIARYSNHVLDTRGPLAWGMKTYSYQFYENTYAITKLAFDAIETPCWAPHDKPTEGSDTPGLSDAGVNVFSASYQDWHDAEAIFCSGVSLYDAHGVLFSQWVKRGGAKLVVVNPRRDVTAEYAEANGGLFLQVTPGTDTALHNAIARVIIEEQWYDLSFIDQHVATELDLVDETKWRQSLHATTFDGYVEAILADDDAIPENAALICGVPADKIRAAAEMLAKPDPSGIPVKSSFMLEKGNYWSHNYWNTASFGALALLCGAGNRPGRMISRAGGHQRGMIKAANYPEHLSPYEVDGNPIGVNLDDWAAKGELDFVWVIGCTWVGGGTAVTDALFDKLRSQTRGASVQLTVDEAFPRGVEGGLEVDAVVASFQARAAAGGMVMVQQDLYAQKLTELADLVLPAAGWGEATFSRMQGERRLRLYPKLADAPGEALPDWKVISMVAQSMGFEGFDWRSEKELFEAAAAASSGPHAFYALVEYAAERGESARDVLRLRGTLGYQCPLSYVDGEIVETVRYHDAETGRGFSSATGKAIFIGVHWSNVVDRQERLSPRDGEVWVTNRRTASNWSSMVEDQHIPFRAEQLPNNVLEIHPDDAFLYGVSDGEPVVINTPGIVFDGAWGDAVRDGQFSAVAKVTDKVRPGVTCAYFNFLGDPATAANNAVSNDTDELTRKYAFKLGRGSIRPG